MCVFSMTLDVHIDLNERQVGVSLERNRDDQSTLTMDSLVSRPREIQALPPHLRWSS